MRASCIFIYVYIHGNIERELFFEQLGWCPPGSWCPAQNAYSAYREWRYWIYCMNHMNHFYCAFASFWKLESFIACSTNHIVCLKGVIGCQLSTNWYDSLILWLKFLNGTVKQHLFNPVKIRSVFSKRFFLVHVALNANELCWPRPSLSVEWRADFKLQPRNLLTSSTLLGKAICKDS